MKISDFQSKDVINVVDGKKLGYVRDLELDVRTGRIEAIVVPCEGRFMGWWSRGDDAVIPWQHIVKIGADVILIKRSPIAPSKEHEEPQLREAKR